MRAETVDELIISTIADMANSLLGIPLALFTIKIIQDYASLESFLLELKDEEVQSAPNPDAI